MDMEQDAFSRGRAWASLRAQQIAGQDDLGSRVFTMADMMGALEPGAVVEIDGPIDLSACLPYRVHPMPSTPLMWPAHNYTNANPPTTGAEVEARADCAAVLYQKMRDAMDSHYQRVLNGLVFGAMTSASWQPEVRDSDLPGIKAAEAHAEAVAAFNPPPIQPSRVKPAISGMDATASGDHRLGRFGVSVD